MSRNNRPIYHIELIKADSYDDDDNNNYNNETTKSRIVQVKHLVSSCYRKQYLLSDHDDAMTALVTFTIAANSTVAKADEQTLANPTKFQQINLFTEDKSQLRKVKQVQINYMSDIDYDRRQSLSSVYPVLRDQSPRERKRSPESWSLGLCAQSLLSPSNQSQCSSQQHETFYELSLQAKKQH